MTQEAYANWLRERMVAQFGVRRAEEAQALLVSLADALATLAARTPPETVEPLLFPGDDREIPRT